MNANISTFLRYVILIWILAGSLADSGRAMGQAFRSMNEKSQMKSAVNPFLTIEEFKPIEARKVRFTIFAVNGRTPCIDELEIFTDESSPRNVALHSTGAVYSDPFGSHPSGLYPIENIGDGEFGTVNSWISELQTNVWIEVEFPQIERIHRIQWSRDRNGIQWDRTPVEYRIEATADHQDWVELASSKARLPGLFLGRNKLEIPNTNQSAGPTEAPRPPVNVYFNSEQFSLVQAKFVRLTITNALGDSVCLDELEVYSDELNVALAALGSSVVTSISGEGNTDPAFLNDGTYGDASKWCEEGGSTKWIEVQLPEIFWIDRVVWSRDRLGGAFDGVPLEYRIEVAVEPGTWTTVATSSDREVSDLLELYPNQRNPSEFIVDTWDEKDGIPLNSINDFAQTPDGYLWIATDKGLLRFDGHQFSVFDPNNTPAISTPKVFTLYVDQIGKLWIVNPKHFYQPQNNLVVYEHGIFNRIEIQMPHKVLELFEEKEGPLWVFTNHGAIPWHDGNLDYDRLLSQFNLKTLEYIPDESTVTEKTVWEGIAGKWIHGEFIPFFGGRGYPVRFPSEPNDFPLQLSRRDGGGWVLGGGWNAGRHKGQNRWRRLLPDGDLTDPAPFPWTTKTFDYRWHLVDRSDNLWISTPEQGLNCLLANGDEYRSFNGTPGLEGVVVRKMFQDRDGNIWLATEQSGLKCLRKRLIQSIDSVQGMNSSIDGVITDNVYSVTPAQEGGVYIGTHMSGAYHWQNGKLSLLRDSHPLSWSVFQDSQGGLWTAAYDKGPFLHNDGHLSVLPSIAKHPASFLEDSQGRMWSGGDFGLLSFDRKWLTGYVPPSFEKTKFEWIISLLEDESGTLWAGSKLGYLYRFKDERFEEVWVPKKGDEFPVCALYIDPSGALWMARFGFGMTRFKEGVFTHYTPTDGLPVASINGVLEDQSGSLWMTSKSGVYQISSADFQTFSNGEGSVGSWKHFTAKEGLPSNFCQGEQNQPSLCQTSDGRIWVPTLEGVGCIDPEVIRERVIPPSLTIQEVTLYSRDNLVTTLLADGEFSSFKNSSAPVLTIPPGKNNLHIRYTAIDFIEPTRVGFLYRLVGLDDDWIHVQNERTAFITNLKHGNYTFELKAINHRGQSSDPVKLALSVLPYWWETSLFKVISTLGMLVVCGFYLYFWIQKLNRKSAAQADFSRQLIEREETERKRISQALHDSLGHELLLVRNRALDGANKTGSQEIKQHFEGISEMAGQALENARGLAYHLRPFELDRIGFRKAVEMMIDRTADSSKIRFFREIDDLEDVLPIQSLVHLYRLIQEGLSNIIKHAKASVVMIEVKKENECVRVELDDNGIGFNPDSFSSSMGMNGMRERAALIGGEFSLCTALGKGTRLRVYIPLKP